MVVSQHLDDTVAAVDLRIDQRRQIVIDLEERLRSLDWSHVSLGDDGRDGRQLRVAVVLDLRATALLDVELDDVELILANHRADAPILHRYVLDLEERGRQVAVGQRNRLADLGIIDPDVDKLRLAILALDTGAAATPSLPGSAGGSRKSSKFS